MTKKRFHKKYNDYMNMVINSPEYKGLLSVDLQFGKFNWLGPLSTPKGKARRAESHAERNAGRAAGRSDSR